MPDLEAEWFQPDTTGPPLLGCVIFDRGPRVDWLPTMSCRGETPTDANVVPASVVPGRNLVPNGAATRRYQNTAKKIRYTPSSPSSVS